MNNLFLYFHSGSKNHGCEAIVRGTASILKGMNLSLISFNKREDEFFHLNKIVSLIQQGPTAHHAKFSANTRWKLFCKTIIKKFLPNPMLQQLKIFRLKRQSPQLLHESNSIFFSIGGDNYCYGDFNALAAFNKLLNTNSKTILWGCSIEPEDIANNKSLRKDLNRYALITARESITFNALVKNGITKNTHLFPDPAFVMDKVLPQDLPPEFIPANTVGINLSPMVQNLEQGNNITLKNFQRLLEYILQETDMNIALIPHVIWENNNDLEPLTKLYRQFKHTGRVCLIDKLYNAMELKGIISQCRFMVAARTHASIAAYSTQVPTLVIGYSVKARGIARDIFGTEEGYVLPVQGLKEQDEVTRAFVNLLANEAKIRAHYKEFMPGYIAKAYQAAEEVKKLL